MPWSVKLFNKTNQGLKSPLAKPGFLPSSVQPPPLLPPGKLALTQEIDSTLRLRHLEWLKGFTFWIVKWIQCFKVSCDFICGLWKEKLYLLKTSDVLQTSPITKFRFSLKTFSWPWEWQPQSLLLSIWFMFSESQGCTMQNSGLVFKIILKIIFRLPLSEE